MVAEQWRPWVRNGEKVKEMQKEQDNDGQRQRQIGKEEAKGTGWNGGMRRDERQTDSREESREVEAQAALCAGPAVNLLFEA